MIRPSGPMDAKIMLVGEAAGETEEREGVPFVGSAGRILDGLLRDAGIVRETCYITNVMLERPEGNNFGHFYEDKGRSKPTNALQEGIRRLHDEIKQVNPCVVVALGEEALRALTDKRGIGNWRGSVIAGLTGHKVIPTYHPAAILREWDFRPAALMDMQRVRGECTTHAIRSTERRLEILRDFDQVIATLDIMKENKYVAFDIETESGQITAISFAPSSRPHWAICIPFWFGASGSLWPKEQEVAIWDKIREVLTDDGCGKIAHNGMYDIEFIDRTMGFHVRPLAFDTMLGMHCLYLELPKSLAFAVSIYTDHPYYKQGLHATSMDAFFLYNATDACLTMEIAEKLMREIKEDGLWQFYLDYLHSLVEPLLAMQQRGVKFDYLKRNSVKKRYQEEIAVLQRNLDAAASAAINVNSPKQMKEWLYGSKEKGGLGLKERTKKRKSTGETTVAADDEALQDIYQETENNAIRLVLQIREKQKILSTYLEVKLDEDKRIRCSYNITGTETGRLSSGKTARGTGTNLQNVPSGIVRSLFVPDDGKVFINADLSQAEARVVAYLSNEQRLIRVFEEGGDIHRKNAANIYGIPEEQVTDNQRQLAKRVVHASNYGMGPITFARTAGISAAEAKRLLNQYFATYPGIANWHLDIRNQLNKRRYLVTPFGRKRYFYNRWGEDIVKEGLAYIPQSTVADIVTTGLACAHKKGIEVLLQVHDALLVQAPVEQGEEIARSLKECLSIPLEISGRVFTIPVDLKMGSSWDDLNKL